MCCRSVMPFSKSMPLFCVPSSCSWHALGSQFLPLTEFQTKSGCSPADPEAESKWLQPNWSQLQRKERILFPGSIWCNQYSEFLVNIRCTLTPIRTHHQFSIVSDSSWKNCMYFWLSIITLVIFLEFRHYAMTSFFPFLSPYYCCWWIVA